MDDRDLARHADRPASETGPEPKPPRGNGFVLSLLGLALATALGLLLLYQPLSKLGGSTTGPATGEGGRATPPQTPTAPLPSK